MEVTLLRKPLEVRLISLLWHYYIYQIFLASFFEYIGSHQNQFEVFNKVLLQFSNFNELTIIRLWMRILKYSQSPNHLTSNTSSRTSRISLMWEVAMEKWLWTCFNLIRIYKVQHLTWYNPLRWSRLYAFFTRVSIWPLSSLSSLHSCIFHALCVLCVLCSLHALSLSRPHRYIHLAILIAFLCSILFEKSHILSILTLPDTYIQTAQSNRRGKEESYWLDWSGVTDLSHFWQLLWFSSTWR